MSRSVNVACLQLEAPGGLTPSQTAERARALISDVEDVDLIVLPELWATGYFNFQNYRADAQPLDGPVAAMLSEVARRSKTWLHGGTILERAPDGTLHNTSVLFDRSGNLAHTYRKSHLFSYESLEADLVTPGRKVETATTDFGLLGLSICYDLRFPELYRQLAVDHGAEILLVSSAWPASRLGHWELLVRARAVENQAFLIACNGAGVDHDVQLAGNSLIVDPSGATLARADDRGGIIYATVELSKVAQSRREFPTFADRWIADNADGQVIAGS